MVATSILALTRTLALSVLVTAAHPSINRELRIVGACSSHVLSQPDFCDSQIEILEIRGFRLNKLPPDLGKRIPHVKVVRLVSPSIIFSSPTQEKRDSIIACREAEELLMPHPFFWSPYSIGWIKSFFPSIDTVRTVPGALPVRSEDDVEVYSAEEFKMESVKHFLLAADVSAQTAQKDPPLLENLKLFPKLETIYLGCSKFAVLNHAQGAAVVLPHVNFIEFGQSDADRELLSRLPTALPQLKIMTINANIFHRLMSKDSAGASISPFKHLVNLHINCRSAGLDISAQIGSVFPLLSRIVVSNPGEIRLLPAPGKPLESVNSVEVYFGRSKLPPNFFRNLFPRLSQSGFKQIYCGVRGAENRGG